MQTFDVCLKKKNTWTLNSVLLVRIVLTCRNQRHRILLFLNSLLFLASVLTLTRNDLSSVLNLKSQVGKVFKGSISCCSGKAESSVEISIHRLCGSAKALQRWLSGAFTRISMFSRTHLLNLVEIRRLCWLKTCLQQRCFCFVYQLFGRYACVDEGIHL